MKIVLTLLKRYILTLITLIAILYLTFCKPMGLGKTSVADGMDKLAHFVMYFTLCAVFWYESFKITLKLRMPLMTVLAVIVPIIFSGAMEYLQYLLTSYRTGDFADFVFNTIGVLAALLFSLYVTKPCVARLKRKKAGK